MGKQFVLPLVATAIILTLCSMYRNVHDPEKHGDGSGQGLRSLQTLHASHRPFAAIEIVDKVIRRDHP